MGGGSAAATNVDSIQSICEAEADLRQELAAREQLKRELTYLEKGGNPLDFKFCEVFAAADLLASDLDLLCLRNTFEDNDNSNNNSGYAENGKYVKQADEASFTPGETPLENGSAYLSQTLLTDGPVLRTEAPGPEGGKAQKKVRNNSRNDEKELDNGFHASSSPRSLLVDSENSSMCRFQVPPTCSADVREIGTHGGDDGGGGGDERGNSKGEESRLQSSRGGESSKPGCAEEKSSGDGVEDQTPRASSGELVKEKGGEEEIVSAAGKKAQEDVILEEAEAIKASRKQTAELARRKPGAEPARRKSHWDFVLEEMAWLANDFMQERLWKTAAAAQVSRWVLQKTQQSKAAAAEVKRDKKRISHRLADIVTSYWQSATGLKNNPAMDNEASEAVPMEIDAQNINNNNNGSSSLRPLQKYILRRRGDMMDHHLPSLSLGVAKADLFFVDSYPEESLFFVVPEGAFEAYRFSIEQNWDNLLSERLLHESLSFSEQKPVLELYGDEPRPFGARESPKAHENDYGMHYMPGDLKISKKKRKKVLKSPAPKALEVHGGFSLGDGGNTRLASSSSPAKRPTQSSIGVIPTKRMRSSAVVARQRAASAAMSPGVHQRGASSASTNSQQEDLLGFPESSRISESDSAGPSSRKAAMALKKKKKKARGFIHSEFASSGDAFSGAGAGAAAKSEAESQQEALRLLDQDHFKRKNDQFSPMSSEHEDTPGTPGSQGLIGIQPQAKKLKTSKHSPEFGDGASAMQGTPNSRLFRQNSTRDRIRRNKTKQGHFIQPSCNPPGVGVPWSTIEDQAILALVHDLGPNWELVTDVLSSSSQLKGVFRKPKDCKERHKFLLERLSIENGENIEDPGTSSWPGIARGNARSILQRLQGPMEEDTVKIHFERIVNIVQSHRSRQQPDALENQEQVPVHQSHLNVASQHPLLSPLDLCEHPMSNGEIPGHGYPSVPHPGLGLPGVLAANGMRPNAPGLPLLPLVSPSSAAMNAAAARDAQRMAASMSAEEQRMRYTRMLAGRSLQPQGSNPTPTPGGLSLSNLPTSSECSVAMLPAGSPGGLINLNRGLALPRPPLLPGLTSAAAAAGMMMPGLPSSSGPIMPGAPPNFPKRSGQMIRPGRTMEEQKQQIMQELQQQAAQGNPQAVAALNNISNMNLSNPLVTSPTQSFAPQQQQQHMSPQQQQQQHQNHQQHQAYLAAVRLVNERQAQQQQQAQAQQHQAQQQQQKRMLQAQANSISPGLLSQQQALGLQGGLPPSPSTSQQQQHSSGATTAQISSQAGQASSLHQQLQQQQQQQTKAQVPPPPPTQKPLTKQASFHQHQLLQVQQQASKVAKSSSPSSSRGGNQGSSPSPSPQLPSPPATGTRSSLGSALQQQQQGLKQQPAGKLGPGPIQLQGPQPQKPMPSAGKQAPQAASPVPAPPSTPSPQNSPAGVSQQQQMPQHSGGVQSQGSRRQQQQQQQQQQQGGNPRKGAQQKAQSSASQQMPGVGKCSSSQVMPGSGYQLAGGAAANMSPSSWKPGQSFTPSYNLTRTSNAPQAAASNGSLASSSSVLQQQAGKVGAPSPAVNGRSSTSSGTSSAATSTNSPAAANAGLNQRMNPSPSQQMPVTNNTRAAARPSLIPQAPVGPAFQGSSSSLGQSNPMLVYGVQPRPVAPLQRAASNGAAPAAGSSSAAATPAVVSSSSSPR